LQRERERERERERPLSSVVWQIGRELCMRKERKTVNLFLQVLYAE